MAGIFLNLAKQILTEEIKPLTPNQIWQLATSKGYDKKLGSISKAPQKTLYSMLFVDVRDNSDSIFIMVAENPKRYYLKSLPAIKDKVFPPIVIDKKDKLHFFEKELHPFLAYFGNTNLNISVKTINHNIANKKEYGEWVHPDMVGCYFPYNDWQSEVVAISSSIGNTAIKLFSFELKLELRFGNLRESFFQAVSNSSWANEGYLVAAKIESDKDFMDELKRLTTSFGIGVISLDVEDPDSSEILFPANPRDLVDWETANKLSRMNPDFSNFLKRVNADISIKEVMKGLYDKVLERDELIKSIK